MRINSILTMIAFSLIGCGALDYNDSIGMGYTIWRSNSFEKVIGRDNGSLIYTTGANLGPLNRYAFSGNLIVAEHYGAIITKNPAGVDIPKADTSTLKYIIIDTTIHKYKGPLMTLPASYKNLEWNTTRW